MSDDNGALKLAAAAGASLLGGLYFASRIAASEVRG